MNKWNGRLLLAIYVLTFGFAYVFVITLVPGAVQNDTVTGMIVPTFIGSIIGFFFGSSDKKGKDDSDIGSKPPPPVVKPDGL